MENKGEQQVLIQVVRLDFEKTFAKNKIMKGLCSSGRGGTVKARKAVEVSRAISVTLLDKTVD